MGTRGVSPRRRRRFLTHHACPYGQREECSNFFACVPEAKTVKNRLHASRSTRPTCSEADAARDSHCKQWESLDRMDQEPQRVPLRVNEFGVNGVPEALKPKLTAPAAGMSAM